RDEHGDAPFHIAAALGRSKIMESLIAATSSFDPNEADGKGRTPLFLASAGGDAPTVELLLILKADVRARLGKTDVGFTAFDVAARAGHTAAKELLRGHGMAERAGLTDGATLHEAAKENNVPMIDYLVESGTEVDSESEIGLIPLHTAALKGASEAMAALIKHGANLNALDREGQSSLHLAAMDGSTSAVDVLCAAGMDLDLRVASPYSADDDCWSALDCAAFAGNVDAVKVLARHGANVRAVSSLGLTVMNSAAAGNHTEVIDALVAIGPSVNGECDDEGSTTPLHTAVLTGNRNGSAVAALLRHGAATDTADSDGNSPLHLAARNVKPSVDLLLRAGADETAVNNAGHTPHDRVR
ncbi:unnamed protein product, partial [Scytosiphon promiscuus]